MARYFPIEQYNDFLAAAREQYGITYREAQALYREVRDYYAEPASADALVQYAQDLADDDAQIAASLLYDLDVVGPAYAFDDEPYPDDYELDVGAELEMTAETYKSKE